MRHIEEGYTTEQLNSAIDRLYRRVRGLETASGVALEKSAPLNPDVGATWYDIAAGSMKAWNGTTWDEFGSKAGNLSLIAKTASYTLTAQDLDSIISNNGAVGGVTFTLPPAKAGREVRCVDLASNTVFLDPVGSDTIQRGSVSNGAGVPLTSSAVADWCRLYCFTDGAWKFIEGSLGWSF